VKTENTINKEINELKEKIYNINEEVTHDMEKPQEKKMKQKYKQNGRPLQQIRSSRR
jgi:uncharacterized coiled-coil DUF342 family protein